MKNNHGIHISNHFMGLMHSYSMVFFSKNIVFSVILMLVSFFDPIAGVCGLLSVIISNLSAQLLGFNRENIRNGIYGFNAALVGLGIGNYFQLSPEMFLLLIIASILTLLLSVAFEGVLGKYGLPFLTLPFLVSFWLIMLASRQYVGLHLSERGVFMYNQLYINPEFNLGGIYNLYGDIELSSIWKGYFKSLSAIVFQYHLFAGILIAIGLILYSRLAFLLSLLGYFSAYYFYSFIGANFEELNYSYIGFNFILTAIAIGGFFVISSKRSVMWVILLVPITSILISSCNSFFALFQLSALSLPFNVTVILFLYVLKLRENPLGKMKLVQYQEFMPEKNLYSSSNYQHRFGYGRYFPIALPFMGEWTVSQAHSGEYTHREKWQHAWDFVIKGADGLEYRGSYDTLKNYHCYGKPIVSPVDGYVVDIHDNIPDNKIGEMNLQQNWGNSIVIKVVEGLYVQLSHIQAKTFKVQLGDYIKKGDMIALCGNSGRSPYPHLHFQIQSMPYVGSETIYYPLAEYIENNNEEKQFVASGIPKKDQSIANNPSNKCLLQSFCFIPGQTLAFNSVDANGNTRELLWEVRINFYNQTYLYCLTTKAKAWFYNTGKQFYFTAFEGDKKSELFNFYRAAYRVAYCFTKDTMLLDHIPLTMLYPKPIMFFQDIFSPFKIFVRYSYQMRYVAMNDELNEDDIVLESNTSYSIFGNNKQTLSARFMLADNKIQAIEFNNDRNSNKSMLVRLNSGE